MSNLQNFNNIFANFAESAYNDRPNSFSKMQSQDYDKPADKEKGKEAIRVDGGENLPNDGVVYLQPDEKGLLADEKEGLVGGAADAADRQLTTDKVFQPDFENPIKG